MSREVQIPCPRCDGNGRRPTWKPDAGICYRCKGRKVVCVNLARHEAALRMLRRRYVHIRGLVRAGDETWSDQLRSVTENGLRIRAELESALARS